MSESDNSDNESMNYAILGDDSSSELDKLEKYTGEVDWKYLEPHYKADALLYVDPSLDLLEVGKAFTNDDSESVSKWKKSGDILQPSTPHAYYWEESETTFTALVVSPFVLIQPIESDKNS